MQIVEATRWRHVVKYDHHGYGHVDHQTWSTLMGRMERRIGACASKEYAAGYARVSFNRAQIVNILALSHELERRYGWRLVPVDHMVPNHVFFEMLTAKTFPIMVQMRRPEELEFAKLPDVFHDTIGHVPLLTSPSIGQFLTSYAEVALDYLTCPPALECLSSLMWYTLETGLVWEDGGLRAYGAAIMTSEAECRNFMSAQVLKQPFDIETVLHTNFVNLELQRSYFVLDSLDSLLGIVDAVRAHLPTPR